MDQLAKGVKGMQIQLSVKSNDRRRVDFHGNAKEGVWVELVGVEGVTYFSKQITEQERLHLINTLTRIEV